MRILCALALMLGLAGKSAATPYYNSPVTSTAPAASPAPAWMSMAGIFYLNASTQQYTTSVTTNAPTRSTWTIVLDGTRGTIRSSSGAFTAGVQVGTGPQASTLLASPMGSNYALRLSSGLFLTSGPIVLGNSDSFIKFPDGTTMKSSANINSIPPSIITGGTLPANVLITTGNVQNGFNAANQFLQVGSDGKLPIIDGSNLTNVTAATVNLSTAFVVGQSTGGAASWGPGLGYNNGNGGYFINGWTLVGYSTGGVSPIVFTGAKSTTSYLIEINGFNTAGNGAYATMAIGSGISGVWQVQCSSNDATTRNRGSTGESVWRLTGGDALYPNQPESYTIRLRGVENNYSTTAGQQFWGASWTANNWHDNGLAVSETCTGGGGTTTVVTSPTTITFAKVGGTGGTWNGTIYIYARRDFNSP